MFEHFTHHLELRWSAAPAAQSIGRGDKIQTFPDIENFRLERFRDLRSDPLRENDEPFKIMLIGSSKTNIFMDGPDSLINIFVTFLPELIGKPWSEIMNMKFEGISIKCDNFLIRSRCNPWIIDKFEMKEILPGGKIQYTSSNDFEKADEICVQCDNFEVKQSVT